MVSSDRSVKMLRQRQIKSDTEDSIWDAEYMQEPAELEGLLFPASPLKYFAPFDDEPEYRYSAVGPTDNGGDDLSAQFVELHGNKIFITEVVFNNAGTDVNIPEW